MNLLYAILGFAISSALVYFLVHLGSAKLASFLKKHGRTVDATFSYRVASVAIAVCFGIMTVVLLYTSDALAQVSYEKRSLQYQLEALEARTPAPSEAPSLSPTPEPAPVSSSEPSITATAPATVSGSAASNAAQSVWVSASGAKYHRDKTCSNMSSPEEISLVEAEARGLTPCKRCYD